MNDARLEAQTKGEEGEGAVELREYSEHWVSRKSCGLRERNV